MRLADLITVDRLRRGAQAAGKTHLLQQMSALMADGASLTAGEAFGGRLSREAFGSARIGRGVAIPHGRVKNTDRSIGAFMNLAAGVDFAAIDNQPVDLLFGPLVPEASTDEHLNLLAQLTEMFSDTHFATALRATEDPRALHGLLSTWRPGAA